MATRCARCLVRWAWFAGAEGLQALFAGRILAFDAEARLIWLRLMVEGKAAGRPRGVLDMSIAAVAVAKAGVVVAANERDFTGLAMIDPMRKAG